MGFGMYFLFLIVLFSGSYQNNYILYHPAHWVEELALIPVIRGNGLFSLLMIELPAYDEVQQYKKMMQFKHSEL